MAATGKPGRERLRYRGGEGGRELGTNRFGKTTTTSRILRSLLRADAGPRFRVGNESCSRPIANGTPQPDESAASASAPGQRLADADAKSETQTAKGAKVPPIGGLMVAGRRAGVILSVSNSN